MAALAVTFTVLLFSEYDELNDADAQLPDAGSTSGAQEALIASDDVTAQLDVI